MNSSIFSFRAWRMATAVIAFFLLMEAIFRIWYFGPESVYAFWRYSPEPIGSAGVVVPDTSSRIGYRMVSGQSGYFKGAPFKTNSHGFRGGEVAIEKAHDVFRIAVLGSSVTMGWGVSNHQTWPAQLQELLDEKASGKFEVLNFAVGGYKALQIEAHFWKQVVHFNPDLVMLPLETTQLNKRVRAPKNFGEFRENKTFKLRYHLNDFFSLATIRTYAWDMLKELKQLGWYGHAPHWRVSQSSLQEDGKKMKVSRAKLVKKFSSQLSEANMPLIVFGLPISLIMDEGERKMEKSLYQNFVNNVLAFSVYDDVANLIGPKDRIYPGDRHPNSRAHRLFSESIFRNIWPYLQNEVKNLEREGR
jgi:hypothetical protein